MWTLGLWLGLGPNLTPELAHPTARTELQTARTELQTARTELQTARTELQTARTELQMVLDYRALKEMGEGLGNWLEEVEPFISNFSLAVLATENCALDLVPLGPVPTKQATLSKATDALAFIDRCLEESRLRSPSYSSFSVLTLLGLGASRSTPRGNLALILGEGFPPEKPEAPYLTFEANDCIHLPLVPPDFVRSLLLQKGIQLSSIADQSLGGLSQADSSWDSFLQDTLHVPPAPQLTLSEFTDLLVKPGAPSRRLEARRLEAKDRKTKMAVGITSGAAGGLAVAGMAFLGFRRFRTRGIVAESPMIISASYPPTPSPRRASAGPLVIEPAVVTDFRPATPFSLSPGIASP